MSQQPSEIVNEVTPLRMPTPWPPPSTPPPTERELSWIKIPLLGWLVAWLLNELRHWQHGRKTLKPIEEDILGQLKSRPPADLWDDEVLVKGIVSILEKVIAQEKLLDRVTLHPEDSLAPLFWGINDDLSPLLFRMEFREKFSIYFPREILIQAWERNWSLKQLVDYGVELIQSNGKHAAIELFGLRACSDANRDTL